MRRRSRRSTRPTCCRPPSPSRPNPDRRNDGATDCRVARNTSLAGCALWRQDRRLRLCGQASRASSLSLVCPGDDLCEQRDSTQRGRTGSIFHCWRCCGGRISGRPSRRSFCRTLAASGFMRRQVSSPSASTRTLASSTGAGTTSAIGASAWQMARYRLTSLCHSPPSGKLRRSPARFA